MFPAGQYRNFPGSRFHVRVYSGGTANSTTVNSSGYLRVSSGGSMANWVELGRGVDMNWTVIA